AVAGPKTSGALYTRAAHTLGTVGPKPHSEARRAEPQAKARYTRVPIGQRVPFMPSSEILVILLLVLLNGFFALSEMALVASKRVRIQAAAEQGKRGAKSALALIED